MWGCDERDIILHRACTRSCAIVIVNAAAAPEAHREADQEDLDGRAGQPCHRDVCTGQLDAATGPRVMRALCDGLVRELVRTGDEMESRLPARRGWRGAGPVEEEIMEIIEKLVAAIDAWAAREGLTGQVVIEVRENVVLVDVVKPE